MWRKNLDDYGYFSVIKKNTNAAKKGGGRLKIKEAV